MLRLQACVTMPGFFLFFEKSYCCVAQADHDLMTLLPQPAEYWIACVHHHTWLDSSFLFGISIASSGYTFIYPLTSLRTAELYPSFRNYKQNCYKHVCRLCEHKPLTDLDRNQGAQLLGLMIRIRLVSYETARLSAKLLYILVSIRWYYRFLPL
jgi:hypothetical protein